MFFFVLWETKGRLTNGVRNPENEKIHFDIEGL